MGQGDYLASLPNQAVRCPVDHEQRDQEIKRRLDEADRLVAAEANPIYSEVKRGRVYSEVKRHFPYEFLTGLL